MNLYFQIGDNFRKFKQYDTEMTASELINAENSIVMQDIMTYLNTLNYSCTYMRVYPYEEGVQVDVGSHNQFFTLTRKSL